MVTNKSGIDVFKMSFDEDGDGIQEIVEINGINSSIYDNATSFSISGSPGQRPLEITVTDNFGMTETLSIPVNVYAVPDF